MELETALTVRDLSEGHRPIASETGIYSPTSMPNLLRGLLVLHSPRGRVVAV